MKRHNAGMAIMLTVLAAAALAGPAATPDLGVNADLHGWRPLPADNPWNQRVDSAPVDPNSDALIASIGRNTPLHPDFGASYDGGPFGIPYVVVAGDTPKSTVTFDYANESDPGPYPIPPNPPIEGGASSSGDRHVIVIDRDHAMLYELFGFKETAGSYHAGSGAIWDLHSNQLRTEGWTSADAAGLPIFPGLVRYDEAVGQGAIRHALRFTAVRTRKGYIYPARHFASPHPSPNLPPMGMRVRLKASYPIASFPPQAQVVLRALKSYGMILADNGSNWFISGAPDARWDDTALSALKRVTGKDLEVVKMGPVVTR